MNPYKIIDSKTKHENLLRTGLFFQFYPDLTGYWEEDREVIFGNCDQHKKKD